MTRERSRTCLRENGTVLYLHAEPETLWQRLRNSKHRPMLHAADPRHRLVELYELRDPLYREVADHVVESDREGVIRFVRWLAAEPSDARHAVTTVRGDSDAQCNESRAVAAQDAEGRGETA